jgi:hypothetical protein
MLVTHVDEIRAAFSDGARLLTIYCPELASVQAQRQTRYAAVPSREPPLRLEWLPPWVPPQPLALAPLLAPLLSNS